MPLEQETISLMIGGYSIVMCITILTILLLWYKNKMFRTGYVWTLIHLGLFSAAIYFFLDILNSDYNHPMASEENSLRLGISGVIWALSMCSFLVALLQFSKKKQGESLK